MGFMSHENFLRQHTDGEIHKAGWDEWVVAIELKYQILAVLDRGQLWDLPFYKQEICSKLQKKDETPKATMLIRGGIRPRV